MRALLAAVLLLALLPATRRRRGAEGPQARSGPSLNADQQQALAPLAGEWDKLSKPAQDEVARHRQALPGDEGRGAEARADAHAEVGQAHAGAALTGARAVPQHRQRSRPTGARNCASYWAEYQALPPHEKRMFDVPPNYVPPAERRQRAAPARSEPHRYVLPAPL